MPPKKNKNLTKVPIKPKAVGKKTAKQPAKSNEVDEVEEEEPLDESVLDDNLQSDEEAPGLEYVSDATKERYEYKPLIRTEIVDRLPEDRITSEVMTKFEYAEIVSIRAKQIENGGDSYTDIGDLTDPIAIAKKEILDKRCPLDIRRMITDKIAERWHVNEMTIPFD